MADKYALITTTNKNGNVCVWQRCRKTMVAYIFAWSTTQRSLVKIERNLYFFFLYFIASDCSEWLVRWECVLHMDDRRHQLTHSLMLHVAGHIGSFFFCRRPSYYYYYYFVLHGLAQHVVVARGTHTDTPPVAHIAQSYARDRQLLLNRRQSYLCIWYVNPHFAHSTQHTLIHHINTFHSSEFYCVLSCASRLCCCTFDWLNHTHTQTLKLEFQFTRNSTGYYFILQFCCCCWFHRISFNFHNYFYYFLPSHRKLTSITSYINM